MASIEDVARKAGVSKALVSRYLNKRTGVGEEKKERIAQAIQELNYRRNDIARSLVRQKTDAVGIILDSICLPFYFELIRGLETGGQETGYSVIFCDCMSDPQVKRRYTSFLSHNRVDGLVFYGSFEADNAVIRELDHSGFPYVIIENDIKDITANKVLVDNRGGVAELVRYFYGKGHRDLGFFCWGMRSYAGQERYRGFLQGMEECGLDPRRVYNLHRGEFKEAMSGQIEEMISTGDLPRVLLFGADDMAFAAIPLFERHGVRIPEDLAISGVDNDIFLSRDRLMPRLTTLEQPLYEMGRAAVHMLAESLENPSLPCRSVSFSMKLIPGETG